MGREARSKRIRKRTEHDRAIKNIAAEAQAGSQSDRLPHTALKTSRNRRQKGRKRRPKGGSGPSTHILILLFPWILPFSLASISLFPTTPRCPAGSSDHEVRTRSAVSKHIHLILPRLELYNCPLSSNPLLSQHSRIARSAWLHRPELPESVLAVPDQTQRRVPESVLHRRHLALHPHLDPPPLLCRPPRRRSLCRRRESTPPKGGVDHSGRVCHRRRHRSRHRRQPGRGTVSGHRR